MNADQERIAEDAMIDEVLAEDFLKDVYDEYDRWRDDECDKLWDATKELYDKFVNSPKHGYFQDAPERFVEHVISHLQHFSNCELHVTGLGVDARLRQKPSVEFVESFEEDKNETIPLTSRSDLGNNCRE